MFWHLASIFSRSIQELSAVFASQRVDPFLQRRKVVRQSQNRNLSFAHFCLIALTPRLLLFLRGCLPHQPHNNSQQCETCAHQLCGFLKELQREESRRRSRRRRRRKSPFLDRATQRRVKITPQCPSSSSSSFDSSFPLSTMAD